MSPPWLNNNSNTNEHPAPPNVNQHAEQQVQVDGYGENQGQNQGQPQLALPIPVIGQNQGQQAQPQLPIQVPPVVGQPQQAASMADRLLTESNRRTWVVGDSIIKRAGTKQTQLHGGGYVKWEGQPGDKLIGSRHGDVVNRVARLMYKNPFPTTVILHIGTNDILKRPTWEIRNKVLECLEGLRALLPSARLIWSDILIRLGYPDEMKEGAGRNAQEI
ncbi:uncharacterized protein [Amphiura filiformis]|uniref:uncharacterized protein n=1 Tax=Amphiura filiformis TaxID=82378 RepID=UPI003B212724